MTHNVIPLTPRPGARARAVPELVDDRPGATLATVTPLNVPLVYTVKEVAALLGLAVGTTYSLVREGAIPAERLGRRWVIPRARFYAWLDAMTEQPADNLSATGGHTGRRW